LIYFLRFNEIKDPTHQLIVKSNSYTNIRLDFSLVRFKQTTQFRKLMQDP